MGNAAATCPHCGYPLAAPPAVGERTAASLDDLGPALANDVRNAPRRAGMDPSKVGPATVNQPIVTTWSSATGAGRGLTADEVRAAVAHMRPPVGGRSRVPPPAEVAVYGRGFGYDYRSKWTLLGLPLLAMTRGYAAATGRKRMARGWIAIGDVAVGGLAIGGAAFGGVCLGGVAMGVVSLGGLAVVLGLAIGGVAAGGMAVGLDAAGGLALDLLVLGPGR